MADENSSSGVVKALLNITKSTINSIHIESPHQIKNDYEGTLRYCAIAQDGHIILDRSNEEESLRQIKYNAPPDVFKPHDLMRIAWHLPKDKYPIGSLLLQRTGFEYLLAQRQPLSPGTFDYISQLVTEVDSVTHALLQYQDVHIDHAKRCSLAQTYGVGLLLRIISWLRGLPRHDYVVETQAKCLIVISNIWMNLGSSDVAIQYGEEGHEAFRNHFGRRSYERKQYGFLLYCIGRAYETKNNHRIASKCFYDALRAFGNAKDCDDNEKNLWQKKTDTAHKRATRNSA